MFIRYRQRVASAELNREWDELVADVVVPEPAEPPLPELVDEDEVEGGRMSQSAGRKRRDEVADMLLARKLARVF
jgi:hypothetical protein